MKILAVGDKERFAELKNKLPENIILKHYSFWEIAEGSDYDLVFDLNFDDWPRNIEYIGRLENTPVIVSAVKKRLAEAVFEHGEEPRCFLVGMNMLSGFIDREVAEVSLLYDNKERLQTLMQQLNWKYKLVDDRAGMVTPRIICMIINEAYFTLQEGTATVEDIDLAMKLGTNYPLGPFEWVKKIGIKEVYETLQAIYADTHDERYKICPLLKTKYLRQQEF